MLLTVVRVYQQGRKLSEAQLRAAPGVIGDVRTQIVQINGKAVRQAVCMGGSKESLPPLVEAQLTGISPLALGLEGYEEAGTAAGIVFYRQAWWCGMRLKSFPKCHSSRKNTLVGRSCNKFVRHTLQRANAVSCHDNQNAARECLRWPGRGLGARTAGGCRFDIAGRPLSPRRRDLRAARARAASRTDARRYN